MSVITAASIPTSMVTDAGRGANHQLLKGPLASTFVPSIYTPVPVGSALKGGTVGSSYSETITAQGGTSPYTFAITSGGLPTGCTMSSGGAITGTPVAIATFTFTVTVTDSVGSTGSQAFTIVITAPSATGGSYAFIA